MQYLFTAIFTKDEDNSLLVSFPDLPGCYAQGPTMKDAIDNAEHVLSLCLFDMEQQGVEIPHARYPAEIYTRQNETTSVIFADTDSYHLRFAQRTERYEVYIPVWLSEVAKRQGLDLSIAVQNGIKREIGMPAYNPKKEMGAGHAFTPAAATIPDPMAMATRVPPQPQQAQPMAPAYSQPVQAQMPVYSPPPQMPEPTAPAPIPQMPAPTQHLQPEMVHQQPPAHTPPPQAHTPPPSAPPAYTAPVDTPAPDNFTNTVPFPDSSPYPTEPAYQPDPYAPDPYNPNQPPPMGAPPVRRRKKKKKDKSSLIFMGVMGVAILFAIGWMINNHTGLLDNLFGGDDGVPDIYHIVIPDRPNNPSPNTETNSEANTPAQTTTEPEPATNSDYDDTTNQADIADIDPAADPNPGYYDDIDSPNGEVNQDYEPLQPSDEYHNEYPGDDYNANDYDGTEYHSSDDLPPPDEIDYEPNPEIVMLAEHFGNSDIIGRLVVFGTNIDFPVVQGADNYHYRSHGITGEPSEDGWIYLDAGVTLGGRVNNTTIFGQMHAGALFYELANFADPDFFNSAPEIHFVTHHGHQVWEPFSFYSDNGGFDFFDTNVRNWDAWAENFAIRCAHETNAEVGYYDRVITLVGTRPGTTTRYIVHARLIQ